MQVQTPVQMIQTILAKQKEVGRPVESICQTIAGLKNLVELSTPPNASGSGSPRVNSFHDWRRGDGGNRGHGGHGGSGGNFRTGVSSPSSAPSTPISPPAVSFRRVTSYTSTTSADSHTSMPALGSGSPASRYQSKFKNSNQPVESKILNNIILSKLNKFSPATYADIRDFLYQILGSGEPDLAEMIRDFMMLVFRKAASEEIYCALYAKLLAEISARYKVILEEMHKLHENYLDIFDDITEVPEGGEGYETFVAKNREKRYRQGYSQFLAELAALEILSLSTLEQSLQKLVSCIQLSASKEDKKTLVEEYVDCLVRMSRVLRKKPTAFCVAARASLIERCMGQIQACIEDKVTYKGLSSKARFLMMDVKDILQGN